MTYHSTHLEILYLNEKTAEKINLLKQSRHHGIKISSTLSKDLADFQLLQNFPNYTFKTVKRGRAPGDEWKRRHKNHKKRGKCLERKARQRHQRRENKIVESKHIGANLLNLAKIDCSSKLSKLPLCVPRVFYTNPTSLSPDKLNSLEVL